MAALQAILESDDLVVMNEDNVHEMVKCWIQSYCKDNQEKVMAAWEELAPSIRFPCISTEYLEQAVAPSDSAWVKSLVTEALWFKAYSTRRRDELMKNATLGHARYRRRRYGKDWQGTLHVSEKDFGDLCRGPMDCLFSDSFQAGKDRFYIRSKLANNAKPGSAFSSSHAFAVGLALEGHGKGFADCDFLVKRGDEWVSPRGHVLGGSYPGNLEQWGFSEWLSTSMESECYFEEGVMTIRADVVIPRAE